MDLKYFQNKGDDTFEILLHGIVGEQINGREVASEIHYLNTIGAKVIKERINTIGGSIIDAFSIVSANLSSKCEIHTINEGVADSAGSFILASGNKGKRKAFDFATMMVHNPSVNGIMLDDIEDESLKKDLMMMRDSVVTILANNSDKSKKEIIDLMDVGTRMTAKKAKEFGFIDEIITSKQTPKITENMSLAEIMNICHDFSDIGTQTDKNQNKTLFKMKEVLNYLNLSEDAQENSALKAIQKIEGRATKAEEKVTNLTSELDEAKNQVTEKDEKISELEKVVDQAKEKEITAAVKTAIDSGKFSDENKDGLTEQATAMGIENFNKMVEMIKLPKVDAIGQINNKSGDEGDKKSKDEKLAERYQNLAEKDPLELQRLKNESPKEFEEMFNAWNN